MVSRGEELLAALPVSELACIEEPALLEAELRKLGITKLGQRLAIQAALRARVEAESEDVLQLQSNVETAIVAEAAAAELADDSDGPILEGNEALDVSEPCAAMRRWRVVHSPYVYIREGRDTQSHRLGYKWPGELVLCSGEVDGWLKLAEEDGWMLRDGSALGLGALLVPADTDGVQLLGGDAPLALSSAGDSDVPPSELVMRKMIESVFPKHTPNPQALLRTDPDSLAVSVSKGLRKVAEAYDAAALPERMRTKVPPSPLTEPSSSSGGFMGAGGPPPAIPVAEARASDLSVVQFEQQFVRRNEPVIVRGALWEWAPLRTWSDSHLRSRVGHREVSVRMRPVSGSRGRMFGDVQRMQSYHTETVSMAELLDELGSDEPRYYGARMHLAELLPELLPDMEGGPQSYMRCFGKPQKTNPTCYLGAGKQATPMHFDPAENLLCVVEGAKELTLFHPADSEHLYPVGERNTAVVYSHINFCDDAPPHIFPELERTTPRAARVERGDMLYLPCGWWHAVRGSNDRNLSINYWFALHPDKAEARLLQSKLV